MDHLIHEERQQYLLSLLKNFLTVFGIIFVVFICITSIIAVFVSPFSSHLSKRRLMEEQDRNFVADFCNKPKPAGHVGYGENDNCDDARKRLKDAPWEWAIKDTANDWNLCKSGGCTDIFYFLKLTLAIVFVLSVILALRAANYLAQRAVLNYWSSESFPSVIPTDNIWYQKTSPMFHCNSSSSSSSPSTPYGSPAYHGYLHSKAE